MSYLNKKNLGIKLIHILNKLNNGSYELKQNTSEGTYHVVLYSRNNVGVFAGIYNVNHKHLGDGLVRLQETIELINKY